MRCKIIGNSCGKIDAAVPESRLAAYTSEGVILYVLDSTCKCLSFLSERKVMMLTQLALYSELMSCTYKLNPGTVESVHKAQNRVVVCYSTL
uniref:Uncharacterized protein n=1 Tax=Candidatus Kentrum eta TaxID=2126337 RepID=A0A450VSL4_9GAMM|nr:MAG: hypothetical protein BECKH772B_GA0070898_104601 [Candidatus Kentron sp. H]VFK04788.1 MAG: hypothetical protein BECKH772A_GA0070896_104601 [Candidatus Kentron sp. H]VFK07769.1 MAG: hypothetical protein BECKH772C_GA0070978_104531 [Candidatus Kentron sp. H]